MCRIAGIISVEIPETNYHQEVNRMCESMKHGGPDDAGIFQSKDKRITIGNRRLALIDLSPDGSQPMRYGKDLVITFNGEVYNHPEIRKELIALGLTFKTMSDTEVILAAYKAWGKASFVRLKGMFAFALIDLKREKSYLVRGPIGIKPLYYSYQNKKLIFSSEVRAFEHAPGQFLPEPDWKIYFLAFGHLPEPFTTFNGVKSLPKGHVLEMDLANQTIDIYRYFHFNYNEDVNKKSQAEKLIRDSLRLSVRKHLLSDAPIGLFLSGGIDSSILALLADESSMHITTVSVNFSDPNFSEKKYQRIIAEKSLSKHAGYTLTFKEFEAHFDQAMHAMDQPSNDGINTWFISKFAKENGLKAVLSGIGADELFGGYASFRRSKLVWILKRFPSILLKAIAIVPFNSTKRCYFLSYKNLVGEYLFLRGLYTPDIISQLLNVPKKYVNEKLRELKLETPGVKFKKEKAKISWLETNLYLQNQLLKDTDYMSMSHGLEVRTPFLDVDFVQNCLRIDSNLRFDNKQKKRLLVNAFEGILPSEIWARKKMGFTFPFENWLRKIEKINTRSLYSENETAEILFKKFEHGKLPWAKMLALYQISIGK